MDKKVKVKIKYQPVDKDIEEAFRGKTKLIIKGDDLKKDPKKKSDKAKLPKLWLILLITGAVFSVAGIACLLTAFLIPEAEVEKIAFPELPTNNTDDISYSILNGEPLSDAGLKNAPTLCMQIPNGTDGARPQAGLTQAGVIYEAIAEAGITRFDAVFQSPTSAVIGPIRSLRTYYLDFAAPFNCTVVHAGGPSDAISALRGGGYRDLDESYQYMYRSNVGGRLWNNLFTTSENLAKFEADNGYTSSNPKGFARMTPEESNRARVDSLATNKLSITTPASGNTSELATEVNEISLSFASSANFNVKYQYDINTNTYRRGYQSGAEHEVYKCPDENLGNVSPESACQLTTLTPSVVIAMIVSERKAYDNYHEDINMIGVGDAYIFQNGTAIKANWSKPARDEQIKFSDGGGNEIKLAPGQTFISAVPNYGSVEY